VTTGSTGLVYAKLVETENDGWLIKNYAKVTTQGQYTGFGTVIQNTTDMYCVRSWQKTQVQESRVDVGLIPLTITLSDPFIPGKRMSRA
jgi:hypothetical protein